VAATSGRLVQSMSERLRELLAGPDESIGLVEAALLIAAHEYPNLPVSAYLSRIESWRTACECASAKMRGHWNASPN